MSIEVDATYTDGTLKLDYPLPLAEQQRVKVVVQTQPSVVRQNYGIIGWQGDVDVVRRIAIDSEHSVAESP